MHFQTGIWRLRVAFESIGDDSMQMRVSSGVVAVMEEPHCIIIISIAPCLTLALSLPLTCKLAHLLLHLSFSPFLLSLSLSLSLPPSSNA